MGVKCSVQRGRPAPLLENKWVLRRKLQRGKKSSFWDRPDPPCFLTKTHNDPNCGENVRGLVNFFNLKVTYHALCQNYNSRVAKIERAAFSPGLRETICNEHTITDYLLAIKRITSPFSRYYAHYYACRPKVK